MEKRGFVNMQDQSRHLNNTRESIEGKEDPRLVNRGYPLTISRVAIIMRCYYYPATLIPNND